MSPELHPPSRNLPFTQSQWYSCYHFTWTNPWTHLKSPYQKNQKLPSLLTALCLWPHCLVLWTHRWIYLLLPQGNTTICTRTIWSQHYPYWNPPISYYCTTVRWILPWQGLLSLFLNQSHSRALFHHLQLHLSLSLIAQTLNSDDRWTSFLP